MRFRKATMKLVVAVLLFASFLSWPGATAIAEDGFGTIIQIEQNDELDNASKYITSHTAYMHADGGGKVSVWFNITGTGRMDEIGGVMIVLYERNTSTSPWNFVRNYHYTSNSGMLAYNTGFHGSHVSHNGVAGRQYYAVVHLWAGKDGEGDARERTTGIITAW